MTPLLHCLFNRRKTTPDSVQSLVDEVAKMLAERDAAEEGELYGDFAARIVRRVLAHKGVR